MKGIERMKLLLHTCCAPCSTYVVHKLREDGYDGVELFDPIIGHRFIDKYELSFNAWDCESIVIWNPDIIIPVEG